MGIMAPKKIRKLRDLYRVGLDWQFFLDEVRAEVKPGETMLDAGAGECKWRENFPECNYIGLDYKVGDATWDFSKVLLEANLNEKIPLEDTSVDVVICIQVLEHLSEPKQALREMARVLKPGHCVFLTTPFCQAEHQQPYDFYRYTRYGLAYLAREAGLEVCYIKPMGGYFLLMRDLLTQMHHVQFYNASPWINIISWPWRMALKVLNVALMPPILALLDKLDTHPALTLGYMTKARKPV